MSCLDDMGRADVAGVAARRVTFRVLLWLSERLTALETPANDPWQPRELPFGLWRLRRRVCRMLEALEGESST